MIFRKLLSEIQYKAEERKRQITTSQQVITFQLPEATQATEGREYIFTIPETQPVFIPVMQPTQIATTQTATVIAKVQQPSRPSSASAQPTSYIVVDDQQPGTSRQMIFQPTFSCTFTTGGKSTQHFWIIQSLWSYSKCTTVPADRHTTAIFILSTSTSTITSAIFHSSRTVTTSQPVQPAQISGLARTSSIKTGPSKGHPNLPKTINNLNVYAQKQKKHTVQHLHFPTVHKKKIV